MHCDFCSTFKSEIYQSLEAMILSGILEVLRLTVGLKDVMNFCIGFANTVYYSNIRTPHLARSAC